MQEPNPNYREKPSARARVSSGSARYFQNKAILEQSNAFLGHHDRPRPTEGAEARPQQMVRNIVRISYPHHLSTKIQVRSLSKLDLQRRLFEMGQGQIHGKAGLPGVLKGVAIGATGAKTARKS